MGLEGSMSPSHHIGSKHVRVLNIKQEGIGERDMERATQDFGSE